MAERMNITVSPETAKEVDARAGEEGTRSGVVDRDLARLYALYRRELARTPLSVDEACLLVDVLNGIWMREPLSVWNLWTEVADACTLEHLDQKWGVDGPAFVQRLQELRDSQLLALVDAAERFWAGPYSKGDVRETVKQVFHIGEGGEQETSEAA